MAWIGMGYPNASIGASVAQWFLYGLIL